MPLKVDRSPLAVIDSSAFELRLRSRRSHGTAVVRPPLRYGEAITPSLHFRPPRPPEHRCARSVAEVSVEGDDVVPPGVVEGKAQRLPRLKLTRWWKALTRDRRQRSGRSIPQCGPGCVVDNNELPGVALLDGMEVGHHRAQA